MKQDMNKQGKKDKKIPKDYQTGLYMIDFDYFLNSQAQLISAIIEKNNIFYRQIKKDPNSLFILAGIRLIQELFNFEKSMKNKVDLVNQIRSKFTHNKKMFTVCLINTIPQNLHSFYNEQAMVYFFIQFLDKLQSKILEKNYEEYQQKSNLIVQMFNKYPLINFMIALFIRSRLIEQMDYLNTQIWEYLIGNQSHLLKNYQCKAQNNIIRMLCQILQRNIIIKYDTKRFKNCQTYFTKNINESDLIIFETQNSMRMIYSENLVINNLRQSCQPTYLNIQIYNQLDQSQQQTTFLLKQEKENNYISHSQINNQYHNTMIDNRNDISMIVKKNEDSSTNIFSGLSKSSTNLCKLLKLCAKCGQPKQQKFCECRKRCNINRTNKNTIRLNNF